MNFAAGLFLWLAAIAPFTERTQVNFDTFLDLLNPWGAWTSVDATHLGYSPYDVKEAVPFTHGRWEYSDYGWTWIGLFPGSWATEHYGVWKRDEQGVWSWRPDPNWHAAPVDFRQTKDLIGWRPSLLTVDHQFVENESLRFARPEEWIWVPRAKFGKPMGPEDVVMGAAGKELLLDSEPITHTYSAWREITRPGPAPENFLSAARVVPEEVRKENQPNVKSAPLRTLPTFWTPLPKDAKPEEVYLYRPECFQDPDGIQRRIRKWYAPSTAAEQQEQVNKLIESASGAK